MRTTAIPSMLEILARNYSYRNPAAQLYEMATVYRPVPGSDLADERVVLTLGAYGDEADFFTLKGALEAILGGMNVKNVTFTAKSDLPTFHPGRCAEIGVGGTTLGILGQVHPLTADNYGMGCPVYAAQLDFSALLDLRAPEALYQALPRFPSVTRDIAVVCDHAIPVATLEDCIARGAQGLLKEVKLFDIYTGLPIPAGKKSVAFSLKLRADDRTLTDTEADADVKSVLALLEKELGAVLR
jgi:phenylalanyl-tRNA synthetase beta chain